MRYLIILAAVAGLGASGAALAGNHRDGAMKGAMPADQLETSIGERGYDVRKLKASHDRYKADLVDRESGEAVKASFDTQTGDLVGARLASDDGDARDSDRGHNDRGRDGRKPHDRDRSHDHGSADSED